MSEEQSKQLAIWLSREQQTIKELSAINPKMAAEYAQSNLDLLMGFLTAHPGTRHVFISL